jgi:hypothetical protein
MSRRSLVALLAPLAVVFAAAGAELPKGSRQVISVETLQALNQKAGLLGRFANTHSPFWEATAADVVACQRLLEQPPYASLLRSPLRSYNLQFAGVTYRGERQVVVHGLCPQGPDSLSYTSFGGKFIFAPFHTGRCYFEADCSSDWERPRRFSFGTAPRRLRAVVSLALRLGFEQYATLLAVRLVPDAV